MNFQLLPFRQIDFRYLQETTSKRRLRTSAFDPINLATRPRAFSGSDSARGTFSEFGGANRHGLVCQCFPKLNLRALRWH
jgi:hypothetical protein